MRRQLMARLSEQWCSALAMRREMSPGSPVALLDTLLMASA
jgi:hypothetical protein